MLCEAEDVSMHIFIYIHIPTNIHLFPTVFCIKAFLNCILLNSITRDVFISL